MMTNADSNYLITIVRWREIIDPLRSRAILAKGRAKHKRRVGEDFFTNADMLEFDPPLLNSATPWATTKQELQALYDCPYTGAVTTRTSLLTGFRHDDSVHQYAFVAGRERVTGPTKIPVSISSLNTLGYSPLSLTEYLRMVSEIHSNERPSPKPFIVSVTGQPDDIVECYKRIQDVSSKSSIRILMEVNLSCPNIVGKPPPAYSRSELKLYLDLLNENFNGDRRKNVMVLVGIKTPPYTYQAQFDDLIMTLLECTIRYSRCPISFITATNTLGNSLILGQDNTYPIINSANGSGIGGLAGESLHPLALGNVLSLRGMLDKHDLLKEIAIIGVGGVVDIGGYKRMRNMGAEAVAIGTAFGFRGIKVFEDIFKGLEGDL